jgi:hypothetical protein
MQVRRKTTNFVTVEQCTVVFAFLVTEPASECVFGCKGRGGCSDSGTIDAKTTVHCTPDSSMGRAFNNRESSSADLSPKSVVVAAFL